MILSTDLATDRERAAARAAAPWSDCAFDLAGVIRASLENHAVDLIEASIGPPHARAALVAIYEGADVLLQAAIDLVDAVATRNILARIEARDPLGGDDARITPPTRQRLPLRAARYGLENAAVKVASAADHLVNAHLRIAWEANAATHSEMVACGFDPSESMTRLWSSCEDLRKGLRAVRRDSFNIFESFVLTPEFRRYYGTHAVRQARRFRNQIVHRERPSYAGAQGFGRDTRWSDGRFRLDITQSEPTGNPTLEAQIQLVSDAGDATLRYAQVVWEVARAWMMSVDVWVTPRGDEVTVQAPLGRFSQRSSRDPGRFLLKSPHGTP